jgi:hypothetical protein
MDWTRVLCVPGPDDLLTPVVNPRITWRRCFGSCHYLLDFSRARSLSPHHTPNPRLYCGNEAVRTTRPPAGSAVVVDGAHQTGVQLSRDVFFAMQYNCEALDKGRKPSAAASSIGRCCRVRGLAPSNSILSSSALLSAIGCPPHWTCRLWLQLL